MQKQKKLQKQGRWLHQYPDDAKANKYLGIAMGVVFGVVLLVTIANEWKEPYEKFDPLIGVLWLIVIGFLGVLGIVSHQISKWTTQICPHCYHRGRKGYTICAGCGYAPEKEAP